MILGQVLVEYDNEDWTTREWLRVHDGSFKIFLVEKTMVWSQRPDPSNPRRPLLWPALVRNLIIFFLPWLLIVVSVTISSWPVVTQLFITICAIIVEWLPSFMYKTMSHHAGASHVENTVAHTKYQCIDGSTTFLAGPPFCLAGSSNNNNYYYWYLLFILIYWVAFCQPNYQGFLVSMYFGMFDLLVLCQLQVEFD